MKITQLIKELKELRVKADPDNWEAVFKLDKEGEKTNQLIDYRYTGGIPNERVSYLDLTLSKYQLKVLEIENALYGYWERNRFVSLLNDDDEAVNNMNETSFKVAQARLSNPNKFHWFNEWLDDQLKDIDNE